MSKSNEIEASTSKVGLILPKQKEKKDDVEYSGDSEDETDIRFLTVENEDIKLLYNELHSLVKINTSIIINIVEKYPIKFRQKILRAQYKYHYKTDLQQDLLRIRSGLFRKLVLGIFMPLYEYNAREIYKILNSISPCKNWYNLACILISINNDTKMLKKTNKYYYKTYHMSIESTIKKKLSCSYFQRFLIMLVLNRRDQSKEINEEILKDDLDIFCQLKEVENKDKKFIYLTILTERSKSHLKSLFKKYKEETGNDIKTFLEQVFVGNLDMSIKNLIDVIEDYEINRADEFYKCTAGLATNNEKLIGLVITLTGYQYLSQVKAIFKDKYESSIEDCIMDDTNGDYCNLLLALLRNKRPTTHHG